MIKLEPKARWRLMRRRFRRRLLPAIFLSIVCGGFVGVIDYMGYTGYYWRTRGMIQYHTVREALGAFGFVGGAFFVMFMLWPFRLTSSGGSLDDF